MSFGELTRLQVDENREIPALDIPALEYGTREMTRNGERPQILLTHPEETIVRGRAEKGKPRRFAGGGTVYHGDTECIHIEYDPEISLSDLDSRSKKDVRSVIDPMIEQPTYWYGRDLLVKNGNYQNPDTDPQVAGLTIMEGYHATARSCITKKPPDEATREMIEEDGLTDPDTYSRLNYFLEEETGKTLADELDTTDEVMKVGEYLSRKDVAEKAYRKSRELQERQRGIEPRCCVTDFR